MAINAAEARLRNLGPFNCCYLGVFLLVSFSLSLTLYLTKLALNDYEYPITILPTTVRMAVFLAVALASVHIKSLLSKPHWLLTAALAMTVGMLVIVGIVLLQAKGAFWVVFIVQLIINAAYAVLYLAWMELYARMDMLHVIIYFTLARLLSGAFSFVLLLNQTGFFTLIVLITIPIVSLVMLRLSIKRMQDSPYMKGEVLSSGWSMPVRPVILLAAVGFVNNFIRFPVGQEEYGLVVLGVCVSASIVLLFILFRFNRFKLKLLYQLSIPLMATGVLCTLIGTSWFFLGAVFTNGAYALFSIFTVTLFSVISYRYGINPLWIFGFTEASLSLGSIVSNLSHVVFAEYFLSHQTYSAVVSIILIVFICLSMMLISDKDVETTWGITNQNPAKHEVVILQREKLQSKYAFIAQYYGLTRREEEVLEWLINGESLTSIANQLFIADSTMKTHSRHIYKKIGVSNKRELRDFVQSLSI